MFSNHARRSDGPPTLRVGDRTLVYDHESADAYLLVDEESVVRW
ncbi:hypothetical protein ACFPYI_10820 [Halomarina salina]|uniref:Uncharacterized protein n=1 Tax=Halomarina salina TaxID=1872699 RepID=A0ABD5RNK3_9EURY|nr:hypothetical protein [Halomarina salina]